MLRNGNHGHHAPKLACQSLVIQEPVEGRGTTMRLILPTPCVWKKTLKKLRNVLSTNAPSPPKWAAGQLGALLLLFVA